jgi:Selenocysteine lyase
MENEILISEENIDQHLNYLNHIRNDFLGLDTEYKIATGESTRRVYLDSTASTLMMGIAHRTSTKFLRHYANTHSLMHFSAKIATKTYSWVHEQMLNFVKADPEHYTSFFTGSGTTSGMNRIARIFNNLQPKKDVVLVSIRNIIK